MPTVVVKTGGTHQFGSPGEAAEFLDLFLEKAGFVKEYRWEARLEKTAHCSWDSPPARVVGYKHWVIYLRVKPSINATVDHFVSLLIPDGSGYAAETVYKQLKGLVKSFNRFVRTNGHRKKGLEPTMTHDAIPTILSPAPFGPSVEDIPLNGDLLPGDDAAASLDGLDPLNGDASIPHSPIECAAEAEPTPAFDSLAGVTRHPEKLRFVLTYVDKVSRLGCRDALSFKKVLRRECDWGNHTLRATSLILAWLVKNGYVAKIFDENDVVTNYTLTPRGQSLIADGATLETMPGAAPRLTPKPTLVKPEPEIDPGLLLIRFREKAQELADAGRRLETNRDKYRALQAEMKLLDDEYHEITKLLLTNRESSMLLSRLLDIQSVTPIKT
jgi:DNA-binding MarR family transcriptional regulator